MTNEARRARLATVRTSYTRTTRCIHGHRHPYWPHCRFIPEQEVPDGYL